MKVYMAINYNNPALPLDELMQFLRQSFVKPTHFFCGWSGGVDSTCCLFVMRQFVLSATQHQLTAVHINHCIQSQSSRWQDHCRDLATRYEIDFLTYDVTVDHRNGTECSAREARWAVFESLSSDLPRCIVLGHHAEDQVETFLLNLLRGAGLSGLGCMRRLIQRAHLQLLRPLLLYKKSQCHHYVRSKQLLTIVDPSNLDSKHSRNYLRSHVLPLLSHRWSASVENMNHSVSALQSDWDMLSYYVLDRLSQISRNHFGLFCIDRCAFNSLRRAERHLLIRAYVSQQQWYLPSRRQLDVLLNQIETAQQGRECLFTTHQFSLRIYRNDIFIYPAGYFISVPADHFLSQVSISSFIYQCPNDCRLVFATSQTDLTDYQLLFDRKSKLDFMSASRLKKYYQRLGVPPFLRSVTPIVLCQGVMVGATIVTL